MDLSDFKIGDRFLYQTGFGPVPYRVTDVGTRTVVAISYCKLEPDEEVFDEFDLEMCQKGW